MKDYARLYKRKYKQRGNEKEIVRRIRLLIRRDIPPMVMLYCIIMLVRMRS